MQLVKDRERERMVGDGSCRVVCLGSWWSGIEREREDGRRWILWGRLPRLGQLVKDRERERMVGDGSCGVGCLGWGRWSGIERERMVGDGSCGVGCLVWGSWSRIERERGW